RLSALGEAKVRLTASRDEATAAREEAQRALQALPPAGDIEAQLAAARGEIEGQRARPPEGPAGAPGAPRRTRRFRPRPPGGGAERGGPPTAKPGASATTARRRTSRRCKRVSKRPSANAQASRTPRARSRRSAGL